MNKQDWEKFIKATEDLGKILDENISEFTSEANTWWDNLSYEDKLKAFFVITKKIHQGDIVDKRSYRGVLYDTFGFEVDAYVIGMESGYLDIHNCIFNACEDKVEKEEEGK